MDVAANIGSIDRCEGLAGKCVGRESFVLLVEGFVDLAEVVGDFCTKAGAPGGGDPGFGGGGLVFAKKDPAIGIP